MMEAMKITHHSHYSQELIENLKKCSHQLTKAIILAAKRSEEYIIENTQMPYLMVVLAMANDFRECGDIRYQLAGIFKALFDQRLVSREEVIEIAGAEVLELIESDEEDEFSDELNKRIYEIEFSDDRNKELYESEFDDDLDEEFYGMEFDDEFSEESWGRTDWNKEANLVSSVKEAAILQLLSLARAKHDKEFLKNNPVPKRVLWAPGRSDRGCFCGNCDDCLHDENCKLDEAFEGGFLPSKDYDAEGENKLREHNRPWYIKRGYTDKEFECPIYFDEVAAEWDPWEQLRYARYYFTPEYIEYCDRCSEEFWKQFGLTYAEAKEKLEHLFPLLRKKDELNDVLYHLVVANEVLYSREVR